MVYRCRHPDVDAFEFTEDAELTAPEWFINAVDREEIFIDRVIVDGSSHVYGCSIRSPTRRDRAQNGDYIVRDVLGNIQVIPRDNFREMYEKVDGGQTDG